MPTERAVGGYASSSSTTTTTTSSSGAGDGSSSSVSKQRMVWCYGASLTEGLTVNQEFAPYADWIEEYTLGRFVGVVRGISGDTTEDILKRFQKNAKSEIVAGRGDVVALFGGTNDLGWGLDHTVPFGNIGKMVEGAYQLGAATVLIITLPPLGKDSELSPECVNVRRERQWFNEAARRCKSRFGSKSVCVDLFPAVSTPPGPNGEPPYLHPDFDADGIHLTPQGYQLLGHMVSEAVMKTIGYSLPPNSPDDSAK